MREESVSFAHTLVLSPVCVLLAAVCVSWATPASALSAPNEQRLTHLFLGAGKDLASAYWSSQGLTALGHAVPEVGWREESAESRDDDISFPSSLVRLLSIFSSPSIAYPPAFRATATTPRAPTSKTWSRFTAPWWWPYLFLSAR